MSSEPGSPPAQKSVSWFDDSGDFAGGARWLQDEWVTSAKAPSAPGIPAVVRVASAILSQSSIVIPAPADVCACLRDTASKNERACPAAELAHELLSRFRREQLYQFSSPECRRMPDWQRTHPYFLGKPRGESPRTTTLRDYGGPFELRLEPPNVHQGWRQQRAPRSVFRLRRARASIGVRASSTTKGWSFARTRTSPLVASESADSTLKRTPDTVNSSPASTPSLQLTSL